jgi:hypothetical protein
LRVAALTETPENDAGIRRGLPMDFVEPWMIRSALVVGLLAAANGWLFVLSTKQPPHLPATDRPRHSGKRFP